MARLNVLLLAPVWLQLVHLLLADAVWIAYVFLGAETLAGSTPRGVLSPESAKARKISLGHA